MPASPNATDLDQARSLLHEVCSLASTAMGMCSAGGALPADEQYDTDALQNRLQLLHLVLGRIGWVADLGLRRLGEQGTFARAEDWMLPGA